MTTGAEHASRSQLAARNRLRCRIARVIGWLDWLDQRQQNPRISSRQLVTDVWETAMRISAIAGTQRAEQLVPAFEADVVQTCAELFLLAEELSGEDGSTLVTC